MRLITAEQHYSLHGTPSLLVRSHVPISKQANEKSVTARAFNVCATRCDSFSCCCCLRDKATAIAAQFRLASHAPFLRSVQITLIRSPDSHPPCYCCCSSCCCCLFVLRYFRFGMVRLFKGVTAFAPERGHENVASSYFCCLWRSLIKVFFYKFR